MSTTLGFKDLIDQPKWRTAASNISGIAQGSDYGFAYDHRNGIERNPYLYYTTISPSIIYKFNPILDGWMSPATVSTSGAGGSGFNTIFVPTHGPSGTVGASPATTNITLAALPNSSSVLANHLANSGAGVGYKIRVIDNGAGGSGKIEERFIIANSASTTPVVYFDFPLTFTTVAGSTYEVLSGRLYILCAGTTAAGYWKAYDIATRSMSGNLSTTNLPSTIGTGTDMVVLDEQYVPAARTTGEGFVIGAATYDTTYAKYCLTATASAAGTLTGQTSGGDYEIVANKYRNFQIRIVEDTVNTTAVGQRRKITSHTGGTATAPVYTLLTNWSVQPSSSAKFVIEGNNDILAWISTNVATYSYAAAGFAADANWSTAASAGGATQYANRGTGISTSMHGASWAFGHTVDSVNYSPNSMIYSFRAGALDTFDFSAAATGTWASAIAIELPVTAWSTGTAMAYDNATNGGRYLYINPSGSQYFFRIDVKTKQLENWCWLPRTQGTPTGAGNRMAMSLFIDGSTKLSVLSMMGAAQFLVYQCVLQR
jgi:hypothetical protein